MPQKLSLRWLALLAVILTALLAGSCLLSKDNNGSKGGGPCSDGPGKEPVNHHYPKVCVDDSGKVLTVSPDPVKAWNRDEKGGKIHIQWRTYKGAALTVAFAPDQSCIEGTINCGGPVCTATVNPSARDGQLCKYTVKVAGFPDLDPDTQVDNCCVTP